MREIYQEKDLKGFNDKHTRPLPRQYMGRWSRISHLLVVLAFPGFMQNVAPLFFCLRPPLRTQHRADFL